MIHFYRLQERGRVLLQKIPVPHFLIGVGILGLLCIPWIPQKVVRTLSIEVIEFDTPSGWLSLGEYAESEVEGEYWIIDTQPTSQSANDYYLPKIIRIPEAESDLRGKKEARIKGNQIIDIFIHPSGDVVIEKGDPYEYRLTMSKPYHPAPYKVFMTSPLTKLLVTPEVIAAIAYDLHTNSGAQSGVSSYNFSHTTTGSERGIFVLAMGTDSNSVFRHVASTSYNGVDLTFEAEAIEGTSSRTETTIWSLANPASGSNTVGVLMGGAAQGSGATAVSFTGVDQGNPGGAVATTTVTNNTLHSVTLVTTIDNSWVVDMLSWRSGVASATPGAGQTEMDDRVIVAGGASTQIASSYEGPITPSGSSTLMSWTTGASTDDSSLAALEVRPAVAAGVTSYTQSAYKWGTNPGASTAGQNLSSLNTPVVAPPQGTGFRLRMLIDVSGANLAINGTTTDLQVAVRSGTCDTGFSGESYADVSDSSGNIRYLDNATVSDGQNSSAVINDPRSGTTTVEVQDYEEANSFSNTVSALDVGESGLWDFSLVDFSAPPGTTYCFRAVQDGGGLINTYKVIPEITTASPLKSRIRGTVRLRVVRLR